MVVVKAFKAAQVSLFALPTGKRLQQWFWQGRKPDALAIFKGAKALENLFN